MIWLFPKMHLKRDSTSWWNQNILISQFLKRYTFLIMRDMTWNASYIIGDAKN